MFRVLSVWDWAEGWRCFYPKQTACSTVHGRKLSEWYGEVEIKPDTVRRRIARGMSERDAVTVGKCPSKGPERRRWIEARRAERGLGS